MSDTQRASFFGFEIVSDRTIPAGVVAIVHTQRSYITASAVQFFKMAGGFKVEELTDEQVGAMLRKHIGDRFERERKRAENAR